MVPPKSFLQGLREICTKNDILLIADEVSHANFIVRNIDDKIVDVVDSMRIWSNGRIVRYRYTFWRHT